MNLKSLNQNSFVNYIYYTMLFFIPLNPRGSKYVFKFCMSVKNNKNPQYIIAQTILN